jgi:hypothetical protein
MGWPLHDCLEVADLLVSIPIYPLMGYAAVSAVTQLWDDRINGVTWLSTWILHLYCAKQLESLPFHVYEIFVKPGQLALQMFLHHVVSIGCFSSGLFCKVAHFYGAFALVCETTTIFANNLTILQCRGGMLKKMYPMANVVNGFGLWFTFIPFRLMLFPCWLYMFYLDWPSLMKALPAPVLYAYPATIVILLALSTWWFWRITVGLVKAVTASGKKEE